MPLEYKSSKKPKNARLDWEVKRISENHPGKPCQICQTNKSCVDVSLMLPGSGSKEISLEGKTAALGKNSGKTKA